MKDRGKGLEIYNNEVFSDYYSSSSDLPCKKHPSSSSVGICAYCLKDRLVKLVCSDCGEQRLSSCSCSEISSNRNSCTVDVGSVGRISFLIENEKTEASNNNSNQNSKTKVGEKAEEVFLLKRSSSSCVEIKRKNGFWKIGRLFRKKMKEKDCGKSVGGCEEKNDLWVVDCTGVSRSRSLCSFRGGGFFGSEDGGDVTTTFSGARSSLSAARSSGVNGGLIFDPDRKSGFSETEPRRSGFDCDQKRDSSVLESDLVPTRRVFSLKESYFTGGDDSGFIDLKFDLSSTSEPKEISGPKIGVGSDSISGLGGSMRTGGDLGGIEKGGCLVGDGVFGNGGSCRIFTVNERGIKKSRKSFKGWRWFFRHHQNWIGERKKIEHDDRVM